MKGNVFPCEGERHLIMPLSIRKVMWTLNDFYFRQSASSTSMGGKLVTSCHHHSIPSESLLVKERRYGVASLGSLFLTLSIIGARRVLSDILLQSRS